MHYKYGPDSSKGIDQSYWTQSINSPFPADRTQTDSYSVTQNTRRVLVFDEHTEATKRPLSVAVEAAAQYGGLIIVTSNLLDPFDAADMQEPVSINDALMYEFLKHHNEETAEQLMKDREAKAMQLTAAFRSRLAQFRHFYFEGPSLRDSKSFWGGNS